MTRFDGVALLTVSGSTPEAADEGRRALAAGLGRGDAVTLIDGSQARTYRPAGFPDHLPGGAGGEDVVLTGLRESAPQASAAVELRALSGRTAAGPWAIARAAVMPPAPSSDLLAVQPLPGGRIHVAARRGPTTACGRLPVHGPERAAGLIDCVRCLSTPLITERHDAQLTAYPDLVTLVGPLLAAAVARLSRHLQHSDPAEVPAILDAAVGSIVHGFPGAGTSDEVLLFVAHHREHASEPARAWAADVARDRVEQGLRSPRRRGRGGQPGLGDHLQAPVQLLARLLAPTEAADVLLGLLEEHGPDPAFEPVVLAAARRAGDAASDPVRRWRRLHELAAALAGTPSRPTGHTGFARDTHAVHPFPTTATTHTTRTTNAATT